MSGEQLQLQHCSDHNAIFESQIRIEQNVIQFHETVKEIKIDLASLKKDSFDSQIMIKQLCVDLNGGLKNRIKTLEKRTDLFAESNKELTVKLQNIQNCLTREEIEKQVGFQGFLKTCFNNAKNNIGTATMTVILIMIIKWLGPLFTFKAVLK